MNGNKASILICKDAGNASRIVLLRDDLRVRWALTSEEARSVIGLTRCRACVTREGMAKEVLAAAAQAKRSVATIVLLEPSSASEWKQYFEAGATCVLHANDTDEILNALSDATGMSFRAARRVPLRTEVRFALGAEGGAWQTHDISATGVCIVGFPPYALGTELDLAFDLIGQRYEFNAVVSQVLRLGTQRAVGLAFREMTPELQAALEEVLANAARRERLRTDADVFETLGETTIISSFRNPTIQGDTLDMIRALTSVGQIRPADTAEQWLVSACEAMSAVEETSIQHPESAPAWVRDAVVARLRAYRSRWNSGVAEPPDIDVQDIFGLCQRIAEGAAGSDGQLLVQVTNIRAEIVRALYDINLFDPDSFVD
jgi:hypothetical protein